jgi:hypothetical protein
MAAPAGTSRIRKAGHGDAPKWEEEMAERYEGLTGILLGVEVGAFCCTSMSKAACSTISGKKSFLRMCAIGATRPTSGQPLWSKRGNG